MNATRQRGAPAVAVVLIALLLEACAPDRDIVATERAASGGELPTPCTLLAADPAAALVLYDFEDALGASQVLDQAGKRPASVVGSAASVVIGPPGCGDALSFGNDERHLLIADDPAWTLTQGSIDMWFWVPAMVAEVMGIISRDQFGDQVGHLSVFLLQDRTVMARLQQSAAGAPFPLLALGCSAEPLSPSSWAHFGFNFGPRGASLFVNGKLASRTGPPGLEVGEVMCGAAVPSALIPDLPLPWVVGASIYASMDVPNVRQWPYLNGAIDNLRISAVERDFVSAFQAPQLSAP